MVDNETCLSLKQIKNEILKLNNQLENYLNLKKINFDKATGSTYRFKDVITQTSFVFDKYTQYLIKDEDYDSKIISLQQSILSYEDLLIKEMKRVRQYDDILLIIYLREDLGWSWKKIDSTLHYSEGYSRVRYCNYKNQKL
jgi:hypothetical protein